MSDVYGVVAEEQAKAAELHKDGKVGNIYLAAASRGTVFIETFATSVDNAIAVIKSLPMSAWWNIDVFPLSPPGNPGAAS